MPKARKNFFVPAKYFEWRLYVRQGTWYADGRSKNADGGRHSLGTKDKDEARQLVHDLDLKIAVNQGLAPSKLLSLNSAKKISLIDGRVLYERFLQRPRINGGVKASTFRHYQPHFNKFIKFGLTAKIDTWDEVDCTVVDQFGTYLTDHEYAEKTIYDAIVFVLSVCKWLRELKHLNNAEPIICHLKKPESDRSYCYTMEEFSAMVDFCNSRPQLAWLGKVILALGCTGLRIEELANLQWHNIDLANHKLQLIDETARKSNSKNAVSLKSGRSRSLPIQFELEKMLRGLPKVSEYVFTDNNQQRFKSPRARKLIKTAVIEPLIAEKPEFKEHSGFATARFHSFRHFFISMCAQQNVPIMTLMEWVGHRDSEMIRHYYHLHDAESLRQINNVVFMNITGSQSAGSNNQIAKRKGVSKRSNNIASKRKIG